MKYVVVLLGEKRREEFHAVNDVAAKQHWRSIVRASKATETVLFRIDEDEKTLTFVEVAKRTTN